MKYFAVTLLLYSGFASACIVGPEKLPANASYGFRTIKPFSHGLVTIYSEKEIISRSMHSSINESGLPEFTGIVSEAKGIAYAVTFEYGRGRCMSCQFKYGNVKNGS